MNELMAKIRKKAFLVWSLLPAFLFIGAFVIIITFYLVKISLTTYSNGMVINSGTLENYVKVITDPSFSKEFSDAFIRTLILVFITTPLQLLTGLVTAMLINKKFKGRGIIRSILLLPLAIPTIVTTSVLLILFSKGGHITSLLMGQYSFFPKITSTEVSFISSQPLSLGISIFGKVWRDTPISMLILLSGLQSIEEDQYEAAKTMGSSAVQSFFYITVPLLTPSIASVLILRSIEAWKEFIFPYILAPSYPILGVLIEKYYVQLNDPGTAAMIGIVLILSILATTVVLKNVLNKIVESITKA